jgi:hypothetical protein
MAQNPKNVYCGIVQQNDQEKDDDCLLSSTDSIVTENVTVMRIKHFEAKGPCWARYLATTLWSGQEYFLQIDSHSKFVKNWDTKCIQMMRRLSDRGIQKAVISHYPRSVEDYENNHNPMDVTRMCQSFFNNRGMLSFLGAEGLDTNNDFYETPYVAGGFMLSSYTLLNDVPYDPNLDFLFVGEEIGHSIRIWTSGYNIYTPSENIVYHEYERAGKPKVWDDNEYSDKDSFEKVKKIIGLETNHELPSNIRYNMDKYGLGKQRSLQDYYKFAGIDLKNQRVYKNFCRKNNIANNVDIKQSNEIDHDKPNPEVVENEYTIMSFFSDRQNIFYYFIVFCVFFFIVYVIFFAKLFKNNATFFDLIKAKFFRLMK